MTKTGESYCTARLQVATERERLVVSSPRKPSAPVNMRRVNGPLLRIVPDPRYELVSVLARLANFRDCSEVRHNAYVRDVDATFGPFRDHRAVQTLRRLENERGFHYGHLIDFAVKLVDTETLAERMPCAPAFWDRRASWNEEDAKALAVDLRTFAADSNWANFEQRWSSEFRQAAHRLESAIEPRILEAWLDDYLGTRRTTRFYLTPAFLMQAQFYSTIIESAERADEHYLFLGSSCGADQRGSPVVGENIAPELAMLFLHLRTNAEVSIYDATLRPATRAVFSLVDGEWYDDYEKWHANLARSIQLAIGARFLATTQSPEAATAWVDRHVLDYFWLKPLAALTAEYEAHRSRYPNLHAFFPRIVTFFERLGAAEQLGKLQRARGATRKRLATVAPRIVTFEPPNGAENVEAGATEIKITFDRTMADRKAIVQVGYEFPKIVDWVRFDETGTVLTLQVQLEAETEYAIAFNTERFLGFQDQAGHCLIPTTYRFRTAARTGGAPTR